MDMDEILEMNPEERDEALAREGWEREGLVDVDSGQLMVCDPCYIEKDFPRDWRGDDTDKDHRGLNYAGACNATTGEKRCGELVHQRGHAGAGFATSTAYGDGSYAVYIKRDGKRPAAMLVVMA